MSARPDNSSHDRTSGYGSLTNGTKRNSSCLLCISFHSRRSGLSVTEALCSALLRSVLSRPGVGSAHLQTYSLVIALNQKPPYAVSPALDDIAHLTPFRRDWCINFICVLLRWVGGKNKGKSHTFLSPTTSSKMPQHKYMKYNHRQIWLW